ncbi:MAG: 23S rRNA (uracil(1939)-C(5))-methyltransferase RlmD [Chlamydiae bacterium]|nr:23S rRNA (uracil(1939)-C(5))-methyltransferase RlmD [Chlamydiota bacterium]
MTLNLFQKNSAKASKEAPLTCAHFNSCGGCTSQELPYSLQATQKEESIRLLFGKTSPLIEAPSPWRYRNKMEYSFGYVKGLLTLGLYKKHGEIEDLYECLIAPLWFMEIVEITRKWGQEYGLKSYYPRRDRGHLRTLTLRETSKGRMAILTISGHPDYAVSSIAIDSLLERMPLLSFFICTQVLKKKEPTQFLLEHLRGDAQIEEIFTVNMPSGNPQSFSFFLEPLAFLQPNIPQAEKIYEKALKMANIQPHETVLDLYCGMATLSHFASLLAHEVIGIEINPAAIKSANKNITYNKRLNIRVIEGDATHLPKADVVFVDPPRVGLSSDTISALIALKPSRIIYISCNPITQQKDIAALGYVAHTIQPVDQFPQTPHIENIVLLCAL